VHSRTPDTTMPLIPIPSNLRRELSEALVRKLGDMDVLTQEAFIAEFSRKRKSIHVAFWMFVLGFHYFYLGRIALQIVFWFSFGGFGLWWLIDLFRSHGMVRERNQAISLQVFRDIQVLQ
jgi:hypothetical protein